MRYTKYMEATTAPATWTETCRTCGKDFDPELDDNCEALTVPVLA